MTSPEFGRNPEKPIAVGGGNVFGAFNEQQYLSRLRGPNGGSVGFKRTGSVQAASNCAKGPVDIFEVRCPENPEPQHLFFDIYSPGPNGIPQGFALANPDLPWNLPRSIVCFGQAAGPVTRTGTRKWRIVSSQDEVLGYVDWSGIGTPSIDLPPHTGKLMHEYVDHFVSITPAGQLEAVLADLFERFLPIASGGVARGIPEVHQPREEWQAPVWGEESIQRSRRARLVVWLVLSLAAAIILVITVAWS